MCNRRHSRHSRPHIYRRRHIGSICFGHARQPTAHVALLFHNGSSRRIWRRRSGSGSIDSCISGRCGSRCGRNRIDIGWWVCWWFPKIYTSYVKCCRLIFFVSKIVRSFNFGAPWLWRGDVQHKSILPFGFPIAPKAAFAFRMTLDVFCQSLDNSSELLPIVLFWNIEME